jgi:hypothetical protein
MFLSLKASSTATYNALIQEDSILEYLQAFIYFLSAIVTLYTASIFLKNKFNYSSAIFASLAVGLFFVAMEEISWGQRIFNIPNPTYFSLNNTQNELSIHNLRFIQYVLSELYILTGAYGAFMWFLLSKKKQHYNLINFIVPDWFLSSYFFFVFFIYTFFRYVVSPESSVFFVWRDQEPCELLLSLGFLFFSVSNYLKLNTFLRKDTN